MGSARNLLSADWIGNLKALDLGRNPFGNGAVAVVRSRKLGRLRHLDVSGAFTAPGLLAAAAKNPALRGLTRLNIGAAVRPPAMTAKDVAAALAGFDFPELRHLHLDNWPLGAAGAKALAAANLPNLTQLSLTNCKIPATGAAALAAAPGLQNLVRLNLQLNPVGMGAAAFADRAVMPRLSGRVFTHTNVPAAGIRKLRKLRNIV